MWGIFFHAFYGRFLTIYLFPGQHLFYRILRPIIQESGLIARKGWNVHLQEPFHMEINGLLEQKSQSINS